MNDLFSMHGRLNRARYVVRCVAIGVLAEMAAFLSGLLLGVSLGEGAEPVAAILGVLIGLAGTVGMAGNRTPFGLFKNLERPGDIFRDLGPNWFAAVMGTGIVANASAVAASSWFAMPKSGHSELIPPSGSITPWYKK